MPLNFQSMLIPWNAGLDVKTSPLLVNAPALLECQNGIFTEGGIVSKRNGFGKLIQINGNVVSGINYVSSGVAVSGVLPAASGVYNIDFPGAKLATFNNELLACSPNGTVVSYAMGDESWVEKGSVSPVAFEQTPIVANNAEESDPSTDTLSGVTVTAWVDSRGGVRYSVFDEDTGMVLVNDKLLDSGGTNPHVVAGGGYITIVWANSSDIRALSILPLSPTTTIGPNPLASNAAISNFSLDVIRNPGDNHSLLFAYTSNVSNYAEVGYIYVNSGISSGPILGQGPQGYVSPVQTTMAANASIGLISAFIQGTIIAYLLTADSSAGLQIACLPTSLVTFNVNTVDASTSVVNCGGVVSGNNPNTTNLCWEISAGSTWNHYVKTAATYLNPLSPFITISTGVNDQIVIGTTLPNQAHLGTVAAGTYSPNGLVNAVQTAINATGQHGWVVGLSGSSMTFYRANGGTLSITGDIGTTIGFPVLQSWTAGTTITGSPFFSSLAPFSIQTPTVLVRSVGMASQPFVGGDGNVYIFTVYDDPNQSTLFLYSVSLANTIYPVIPEDGPPAGNLCANGFSGTSGGLITGGYAPRVFSPSSTVFSLPISSRIVSESIFQNSITGTPYEIVFITGIDRLDMEWGQPITSAQAGMNTLFSGGQTSCYDGVSVVESGFPVFPLFTSSDISFSSTGGNIIIPAGTTTMSFQILYFWRDQQRQAWRSAPSPAVAVAVSATTTGSFSLTIPTCRVTNKSSRASIPRNDIVLQVFRTTIANPSVMQLTGNGAADPILAPVYNNTSVDTVSFSVTASDITIEGGEILYTTPTGSGTLPNLPMPPATVLFAGKGRVFLAGVPTQPFSVYYSRVWEQEAGPVEFSPELLMPIPQTDGPITALAVTDVSVLVFKENSVYSFAGDGPDDTGNNSQFTDVNLVTGDVGCVTQNSICTAQATTFFLSNKGIYQIDRSNQVSYIGAAVERLVNPPGENQVVITSAILVTGTTQIRFTTDAGYALTYDYFFKQWSEPTPLSAVSAVNWATGGAFSPTESVNPSYIYTWLDEGGFAHYETPGQYLDGTSAITLLQKTAPLHLAGLQGYQRIQWLYFLCEYFGPHQLQIDLFYDNEQFSSNTIIVDPQSWIQGVGFGDANFGAGSFGGITSSTYQFRIPVARQLCQTLQIQVKDIKQGNTASYAIDSVTIIYGTASGKNPLTRGGRLKTIKTR